MENYGSALVLPLLVGLALDSLVVILLSRSDRNWKAELFALIGVQLTALWLSSAFLSDSYLGAGDSYHYALQLADFIEQLRHGAFPVLVDQSAYGFNGNVHTVRTAPYAVHAGGVLHLLTFGRLSAFGLQNLLIVVSLLGAATSSYIAVRRLAPAWRGAAALLAALYVLCPALMVIIAGMDMYPTAMTLPWLPLFWLGVTGIMNERAGRAYLLLGVLTLGVIAYGHPVIAVWLVPVWLVAMGYRVIFIARGATRCTDFVLSLTAFAGLLCYLVVSYKSLQLGFAASTSGSAVDKIISGLSTAWPATWKPLRAPLGQLGNIQLGYALLGVVIVCFASLRRTRPAGLLLSAVVLGFYLLLWPAFGIAQGLWSLVPAKIVDLTNLWPMQRFYPIMSALIPIWAGIALRSLAPGSKARSWILTLLGVGVFWSAYQAFQPRAVSYLVRRTPAESQLLMQPVNVALGRVAYLFFGFYPAYFSHGVMEPAFESRLLDAKWLPLVQNASAIVAAKESSGVIATLTPKPVQRDRADVKRREDSFVTDGKSQYLLAFNFPANVSGEIELLGQGLHRTYLLPESGGSLAFGAGPRASRFLSLSVSPGEPTTITLRTEVSGLSAEVFAFRPDELPIKTKSLIPLSIETNAPEAGFLETPRVFIAGYEATVNGKMVPVLRSKEGLVAVPVLAGPVNAVVSYRGSVGLKTAFWVSWTVFLVLFAATIVQWHRLLTPTKSGLNLADEPT